MRQLLILALVGLLAVASAAYFVGSQKRLPAPFGPAANGQIVFGSDGDLYVADTLGSPPRLLLGGAGEQSGPAMSPDGQLIAYDNLVAGIATIWVANADRSDARKVLDDPFTGLSVAWAPDSRRVAIVTESGLSPTVCDRRARGCRSTARRSSSRCSELPSSAGCCPMPSGAE